MKSSFKEYAFKSGSSHITVLGTSLRHARQQLARTLEYSEFARMFARRAAKCAKLLSINPYKS